MLMVLSGPSGTLRNDATGAPRVTAPTSEPGHRTDTDSDARATICSIHRTLSSLAHEVEHLAQLGDATVTGITEDSRRIGSGDLFVARRGGHVDGHRFVAEALGRGASAVVSDRRLALRCPQLVVPNAAAAAGPLAAAFYDHPSHHLQVVGVTGTNGKTTTCELLHAAMEATGRPGGQIGTIATRVGRESEPATMTTPAPADLQRTLHRMVHAGIWGVAMEVSSHALDQYRIDGTQVAVGVFTNLDTEHLDYHGTMEQYWASKARLFEPARCAQGVICVDGPWGARLAHQVQVPTTTFAAATRDVGADVSYWVEDQMLAGSTVHLDGADGHVAISTHMVGAVNGANVAAAYLAARAIGIERETVVSAFENCPQPPGRFEVIDEGQPFLVVVDYAHTPDALASLVSTAQRHAGSDGQVRVVVGARGGRDRFKRPYTGAVAASAGWVVLTTDSPGDEDPASIIEQLRLGTMQVPSASVTVEVDRRRAITRAIEQACPGDVVLVVGRGHEQLQHIAGQAVHLDDREAARAALRRRLGSSDAFRSAGSRRVVKPTAASRQGAEMPLEAPACVEGSGQSEGPRQGEDSASPNRPDSPRAPTSTSRTDELQPPRRPMPAPRGPTSYSHLVPRCQHPEDR